MDDDWKELTFRMLNTRSVCARCKFEYLEIDNIGTWGCRQHPFPLDKNGFYLCCGKKFGNSGSSKLGCIKADHNCEDFPYNAKYDFSVPVDYTTIFQPLKESVVPNEELLDDERSNDYIQIRRYDWIAERNKERQETYFAYSIKQ